MEAHHHLSRIIQNLSLVRLLRLIISISLVSRVPVLFNSIGRKFDDRSSVSHQAALGLVRCAVMSARHEKKLKTTSNLDVSAVRATMLYANDLIISMPISHF